MVTKPNSLPPPPISHISPETFSRSLLQWYAKQGRDLPWRKTKDPYVIWISEVMLQQTQVERVKEYYQRFLQRFPNVQSLAKASWEEVLAQWRGLGYYQRARNLHASAQLILRDYAGIMPQHYQSLRKLPGIGAYTAGAISSFAFDQDIPAIDTNVEEVFQHVFGSKFWQSLKPLEKYKLVQTFIPPQKSADFHHALMDLGTVLKTSLRLDHNNCPLKPYCKENSTFDAQKNSTIKKTRTDAQKSSTIRKKNTQRSPQNHLINVAVGLLIHEGKILITQRKPKDSFGGYWEFPGGKIEPGEDARTCLKREIKEEICIEVSVRPPLYVTTAIYDTNQYKISFHRCSLLLGKVKARDVAAYKWIKPEQLLHYKFPPANKAVIDILVKKKSMFRV